MLRKLTFPLPEQVVQVTLPSPEQRLHFCMPYTIPSPLHSSHVIIPNPLQELHFMREPPVFGLVDDVGHSGSKPTFYYDKCKRLNQWWEWDCWRIPKNQPL